MRNDAAISFTPQRFSEERLPRRCAPRNDHIFPLPHAQKTPPQHDLLRRWFRFSSLPHPREGAAGGVLAAPGTRLDAQNALFNGATGPFGCFLLCRGKKNLTKMILFALLCRQRKSSISQKSLSGKVRDPWAKLRSPITFRIISHLLFFVYEITQYAASCQGAWPGPALR